MVWLFGAHFVSLIVDRFYTVLLESPNLVRFRYNNGWLELGGKVLDTMTPDFVWCRAFAISTNGRMTMASGGSSFAFGPGRSLPSPIGPARFRIHSRPRRQGFPHHRAKCPQLADTVRDEPRDRSVAYLEAEPLLPPSLEQAQRR